MARLPVEMVGSVNRHIVIALMLAVAVGQLPGQEAPSPASRASPTQGQTPDTVTPAGTQAPTGVPPAPGTGTPASGSIESRAMSWKLLVPNIVYDQPKIYGFPVQLAHGRHWAPTLSFLALTAGLIVADPHIAPTFRNTTAFHGFNQVFSSTNTNAMIAAAPVGLLAASLITKDHYERNTALLAGEAFADAEILDLGLKYSTRRLRPTGFPPNANYSDSWWESGGNSFPSGHTIAAFAIATVISRRYPHQRWLPYVAYGLAATIGFSRLTLSAHFPADVFVGGILGYTISRFVVLRQ
ncbi:MAG: phosphatase PAP2 family protein [Bryobacteraceae bacterium]